MESNRLPRFRRAPTVASMELTQRDHQIIRLIHRYRFLRSSHMVALLQDNSQQLLRRLQRLYHNGYVERPRAQIDYYCQGGSNQMVYGLGSKGAALLEQEHGISFQKIQWSEKNRAIGRIFLKHALLVSDVMVAIELGCRKHSNIRLLTEEQLSSKPFRWKVKLRNSVKLGVIPDRVFALESTDQNGNCERAFFFLEADRGTMPVKRHSLLQTSFYRKLLAYEATWSQSIHQKRFGFHRFRVLTITTSTARVKSLIDACSELQRGHGLFLFADKSILKNPDLLFSTAWQAGNGKINSLLN